MRRLILFLALSGCSRGGGGAVSLAELYPVQTELAHQAGSGDADDLLLSAMSRAARSPQERAEVARRRCGWAWATAGAAKAVVPCRNAVELARPAGAEAVHHAQLRLSRVLTDAGGPGEGLAIAQALQLPQDPQGAAFVHWARGLALLGLGRGAVAEMQAARAQLAELAQRKPSAAEFLALGDLYLGRALAQAGYTEEGRAVLQQALERQRGLDRANPEYAEYRLYLVRLLEALGALPGENAVREEGRQLRAELIARDPTRAELRE